MIIGATRPEEAKTRDTFEGYHRFHDENREDYGIVGYGSFEVFWSDGESGTDDSEATDPGWYWWACFPGCIPDGEPSGPFSSSREALLDADEWHPEFDDEFDDDDHRCERCKGSGLSPINPLIGCGECKARQARQ